MSAWSPDSHWLGGVHMQHVLSLWSWGIPQVRSKGARTIIWWSIDDCSSGCGV
jgi:hypothetical protein